jgi:hypothetical protein
MAEYNVNKRFYGVSVENTATLLNEEKYRVGLTIKNNSAVTVYLGNTSAVTIATGYPLLVGEQLSDPDTYSSRKGITEPWYAIVATGTADVRVVEYKK